MKNQINWDDSAGESGRENNLSSPQPDSEIISSLNAKVITQGTQVISRSWTVRGEWHAPIVKWIREEL